MMLAFTDNTSGPAGAHQSLLSLQSDSQQHSILFNLRFELRYITYAAYAEPITLYEAGRGVVEVQRQECEFAILKCHRCRVCSWNFSKTGYLQSSTSVNVVKTAPSHLQLFITWNSRFLQVRKQAYVEAQHQFDSERHGCPASGVSVVQSKASSLVPIRPRSR
jgi:hypothetical protein